MFPFVSSLPEIASSLTLLAKTKRDVIASRRSPDCDSVLLGRTLSSYARRVCELGDLVITRECVLYNDNKGDYGSLII